ncbi:MAG TPA: hypothetical protein VFL27_03565 [Candidatus Dormibacteraeota bacterium]|nr:hypothetical protein [Candidatus Dormibacteraeota bacterium]
MVAILVASAAVWIAIVVTLLVLFFNVFIPAVTLGGKGEIPVDFPVYPGAHLESATASSLGGCTSVVASWSASTVAGPVVTFYESGLATGAWTLTDTRQHLNGVDLSFESTTGPRREGVLTISYSPYDRSTTQISLEMYKSSGAANTVCVFGTIGASAR